MDANPPCYLSSKYECFLISSYWDILLRNFKAKFESKPTNTTEQTNMTYKDEHMNAQTERQELKHFGANAAGITTSLFVNVLKWPFLENPKLDFLPAVLNSHVDNSGRRPALKGPYFFFKKVPSIGRYGPFYNVRE